MVIFSINKMFQGMLYLLYNVLFVVDSSGYRKTIVTNKNKSINMNILMKGIFFDDSKISIKIHSQ